jgi:hypothetical protein
MAEWRVGRLFLRSGLLITFSSALWVVAARGSLAQTDPVTQFHRTPDHAGLFIVPGLNAATASTLPTTPAFSTPVDGVLNAAPLYWHTSGMAHGVVVVATEQNQVSALDAETGSPLWQVVLGPPSSRTGSCGNINPVGVTGTPVIDPTQDALYLDAVVQTAAGQTHMIYGLSLATGAVLPGWPVALGAGIHALGQTFDDSVQEQRAALLLLNHTIYVAFGGYDGDCGDYHGIVAAVNTVEPAVSAVWETGAEKGGIWDVSGLVSDGQSIFAATGNTADTQTWSGGEAVVHLGPSLAMPATSADFFSPENWQHLDSDDLDLGGVNATLIDLPGATPSKLALALGKDGDAYLLNRSNLGGITNALETVTVSSGQMRSATTRYTLGSAALVVLNAQGVGCTGPNGVLALQVAPQAGSVAISRAWCAALDGQGSPIVTESAPGANPIVWITGAQGDEELHGFNGQTGVPIYSSASLVATVPHFSTLLEAEGHIYVPADGMVFGFALH